MSKIIIINEFTSDNSIGGYAGYKRNLESLAHFFELDYCPINPKEVGKVGKLKRALTSKVPTIFSKKECNDIVEYIRKSDAEYVFLNNSVLGYFAKPSKECGKKVITYFQNFEYKLTKEIKSRFWVKATKESERTSLEYSDYLIFLNERDKNEILGYYGMLDKKNYSLIPVTLKDKYKEIKPSKDEKPYGLFVGAFYKPNCEAIQFINDNICDEIDYDIHIVGFGLDGFEPKNKRPNLKVIGYADDIQKEYAGATFSILPIFSGGGMKVKTCEALMQGKVIFGSKEALEGYRKDSKDIKCCETKEEFVSGIKEYLKNPKYLSEENRKIFLESYSNDVATKTYGEIIKLLEKRA